MARVEGRRADDGQEGRPAPGSGFVLLDAVVALALVVTSALSLSWIAANQLRSVAERHHALLRYVAMENQLAVGGQVVAQSERGEKDGDGFHR